MSRIGNAPIIIPANVTIEKNGDTILVNGPKGTLSMKVVKEIKVEIDGSQIKLTRKSEQKKVKALHGLMRNLLANMIMGIVDGWSKSLELVGVGFRAQVLDGKLVLNVGYSHPVEIETPEGIGFEVFDNTKIKVTGVDKQLVGQVAANIKKVRPPDVYKGKGIRFEGEYIRKKVGKSAKVGVGAPGAK
jgi:large subunit ribosomal protein L6